MKQIGKKLGSVLLALCLMLFLLPTAAFAWEVTDVVNTIQTYTGGTGATGKLSAAVNGDTVTITGTVTNANFNLILDIGADVTVVWKAFITAGADYEGALVHLNSSGTFEVASGEITATKGSAITGSGHVIITGGAVTSASQSWTISVSSDSDLMVSGGTIKTTYAGNTGGAVAIETNGNTTTTFSGGQVEATNAAFNEAVKAGGDVEVTGNAKISAVNGVAITAAGNVTVSGGTVSSASYSAIKATGANSTVTVSGGTVSNSAASENYSVINMTNASNTEENVTVSGTGQVLAQGGSNSTAYAIKTSGSVFVSGGTVSATTGNAAIYAESDVTVYGGVVFAYGSAINAIIGVNQVTFQPGVVIAWNKNAGTTTYIYGDGVENGDLTVLPSGATVNWAKQNDQNGISYTNGTNTGFFAVAGVTVSKIGVMIDEQDYKVANNEHTDNFNLATMLPQCGADASQVSEYIVKSYTDSDNIFSSAPSINGSMLALPVASGVTVGKTATVVISLTSDVYSFTDVTINIITVAKAPVAITATMTGGLYNGQPYAYSNAAVTNNIDSSNVTDSVTLESSYEGISGTTYGPSATAPTNAGSYQLTLSVPDSDLTYIGSAVYTFTIAKRPVTVKADDKSVTVGSDPVFTYTVDGQLSGETALIGEPDLTFAAGNTSKAGSYTIDVVLTGVSYTDNYMAANPAYVNGTLTVSTASPGGNTPPSGGGSSTPSTPAPTVSGSTATTTVTAQTGTNGTATATVTQSQMSTAITAAQKAAASTGEAPRVEIQISGGSDTSAVETTLPIAAVQALVTGEMETLTLSSNVADITFDAQAIAAIAGASTGDVNISAAQVENSTLSGAAAQVVGNRPVYNFSVTSGGNTISEFDGTVTVSIPYTPADGEDTNAIVAYYINANGEPELMQNCYYDAKAGTLVFTTTHFSTYAVGYNKVSFTDVSDNAWYADAIAFLAARQITSGTTENTFSPDATLTRGQFITLLLCAYGIDAENSTADNFADAGNTYYTGYLAAAKRLGITNGVGDNKFAPEQAVTRQDMFTLLYNALKAIDQLPEENSGTTLSDFADSESISAYAQEAMAYLVKTGVVGGSNGQLSPTDTTTRAQMAQVLHNLLSK